jgi:hypothetical protein
MKCAICRQGITLPPNEVCQDCRYAFTKGIDQLKEAAEARSDRDRKKNENSGKQNVGNTSADSNE